MSNQNQQKFDNYSNQVYYKTNEKAVIQFPSIKKFPDALGFDKRSLGFIVLHKKHKPSGVEQEVPACVFLKNEGYCVELVEEFDNKPSLDAIVDDVYFEIKRISKATDVANAVITQFKRCEQKSQNLILHLDQKVEPSNLKRAIRKAIIRYDKIKKTILIYRNNVTVLDEKMMKEGNYFL